MAVWTFESSNIDGIEYRKDLSILVVHFKKSIWEYVDVPEELYFSFRDAPSPGKYYAANVKGKFAGRKVDDRNE